MLHQDSLEAQIIFNTKGARLGRDFNCALVDISEPVPIAHPSKPPDGKLNSVTLNFDSRRPGFLQFGDRDSYDCIYQWLFVARRRQPANRLLMIDGKAHVAETSPEDFTRPRSL